MTSLRIISCVFLLIILFSQSRAACTGSVPTLSAGNFTDLQSCVSTAAAASNQAITITVTAGSTYSGTLSIPANSTGTNFITIQSSAAASLPAGTRVTMSSLSNMASLVTPNGSPAITFAADSHHWKFIGIAVTTANSFPSGQRTPTLITKADSITYGHWPDSITFERSLVYASESDPLPYRSAENGFSIDGANISIIDCWVGNFMGWEYPTAAQTVAGATNANPVQITLSSSISNPGNKFLIYLSGATGNWTPINGTKVASFVDSTHVTLEDYDTSTFALSNVNSTTFGTFSGQSINRLTQSIATSRAILIITGPGPYTIENNFLESYYTPIFTGGGGTWLDPQNQVTVSSVNSLTQVVLSSVGQLQTGDLIAFSATQDQTITGATAGTTTSITVQTHGYPTGTTLTPEGCITISGFTGSWAPLNGAWGGGSNGCGSGQVTVIDSTHLSIPVNSTGFGAVTSTSPKWVLTTKQNSGATQWVVGKVTNISGTTVDFSWWGHQPENINGNGAGILVAAGATAQFRGLNIHDITVERNTISTRQNWIWLLRDVAKTGNNISGQPPKACWEAKQGDNVTINGNIFQIEGGPLTPNSGTVCLGLNQASQNGDTPWVSLNNWAVTNNIFRSYPYQKISLREEYETGQVSSSFTFSNNLLTPNEASFMHLEGTDGVTIEFNTVRNFGDAGGGSGGSNSLILAFNVNSNSIVRNNIGNWTINGYVALDPWTPSRTNNYLIDNDSQSFSAPSGDVRVANDAAMVFTDVASADAGGDYHGYQLAAGSPGKNASTTGTDVGVNFAALDAALAGSQSNAGGSGLRGKSGVKGKSKIK